MLQIGVISDTHLSGPDALLCRLVEKGGVFEGVSMILHAGDLVSLSVLDAFAPKQVVAVCGNMDGPAVAARLRQKEEIPVEGFRIGLIHGWGPGAGLEERVSGEFSGINVLVFGHSHRPCNETRNGVLLFNPGSFSGRGAPPSVGLLTVDEKISGRIINL